jgi:hypothetical protein
MTVFLVCACLMLDQTMMLHRSWKLMADFTNNDILLLAFLFFFPTYRSIGQQ